MKRSRSQTGLRPSFLRGRGILCPGMGRCRDSICRCGLCGEYGGKLSAAAFGSEAHRLSGQTMANAFGCCCGRRICGLCSHSGTGFLWNVVGEGCMFCPHGHDSLRFSKKGFASRGGGTLAGFVFLLTQVFSVGVVAFGGHIYYPLAAKVLVLMAGIFYLAAALLAAGSLKHRAGETVPLHLTLEGRSILVSALYDTGNTLSDPISGRPVVVLEWQRGVDLLGVSASRDLFSDPAAALRELNEKCPNCSLRLLPYRAVGTQNGLLLAAPCKAKMGRRKETAVLAALSPTPVSDGGGYEALIGGAWI